MLGLDRLVVTVLTFVNREQRDEAQDGHGRIDGKLQLIGLMEGLPKGDQHHDEQTGQDKASGILQGMRRLTAILAK
ncbi:hypothetical protein [Novosphingobium sp. JCM 18896]|uniref:hypothetical protein n=1 Tax=Novosphingobium sp. JCM 18896 TaxID=2989731 RepID=UPI00222295A2|nr:hypothetical protein [Novosphingobium sp. JCM 18896]MCW1432256.1 hypothetical protein [Novosphingobium sp. JCM 18896]